MMHSTERITLDAVTMNGRRRPRLDRVSLTLEPGEVYGLVGPNGAGKSSLLAALGGLAPISSGRIDGAPWQRRRPVGAVFADGGSHPGRTVAESLALRATLVGCTPYEAAQMAVRVGLDSVRRQRVRSLSLGMRMRLSIGVALLGAPELVLLDEPMNGLDPDGIVWMRTVIAELSAAGSVVVVSSHLLAELEHMVDTAVVVSRGEIVRIERLRQTESASVIRVAEPDRFVAVLSEHGIDASRSADVVVVGVSVADAVRIAVRHDVDVLEAGMRRSSLEALYEAASSAEFAAGVAS
jgi:ABC-2 type transport system ATP-binding protein